MAILNPLDRPIRPASQAPPAATRRLGGAAIAVTVAAVLLALAAGWLLRGAVTAAPAPATPAAQPVDLGAIALTVDGGWAASRSIAGMDGLAAESTKAFEPAAGLQARVLATVGPIDHPTLVPAALRAMLPDRLGSPQPARLAGLPAWHYGEQPLAGGRLMELTIVPTSAGVLAVACIAGTHEWLAAEGCARSVRAVDLGAARALEPDEAMALRAALPAAIDRLGARRAELRERLGAATTRRGQSLLAGRLAGAYERAAAELAPIAPAQGRGTGVAPRLRRSAAAYRAMAVAARRNQPVRFDRAGRSVARREAAVNRALARLG
jgi:hypothetical protein